MSSQAEAIRERIRRMLAEQLPVPAEAAAAAPADEGAVRIAFELCRSNRPDEHDLGFAQLRRLFPDVDELELRELVESFQSREEKVR